jgi:hypothetical protein
MMSARFSNCHGLMLGCVTWGFGRHVRVERQRDVILLPYAAIEFSLLPSPLSAGLQRL